MVFRDRGCRQRDCPLIVFFDMRSQLHSEKRFAPQSICCTRFMMFVLVESNDSPTDSSSQSKVVEAEGLEPELQSTTSS
jgi:hypothetical protein